MSVESTIDQIASDLHKIGLDANKNKATGAKKKRTKDVVADSWEDDASDSNEEGIQTPPSNGGVLLEAPGPTHLKSPTTRALDAQRELDEEDRNLPDVPPPTPISPTQLGGRQDWSSSPRGLGAAHQPLPTSLTSNTSSPRYTPPVLSSSPSPRRPVLDSTRNQDAERRRPEKTTATANRLIAGALGIKAPPKTEEQRKYDRAVREQETRRRNKEKEQQAREAEEDEKAKAAIWNN